MSPATFTRADLKQPFAALVVGLAGALNLGLLTVLQHYTLRYWLARSGVFPWRVVPFPEDVTARILLRRVGGEYSFASS